MPSSPGIKDRDDVSSGGKKSGKKSHARSASKMSIGKLSNITNKIKSMHETKKVMMAELKII